MVCGAGGIPLALVCEKSKVSFCDQNLENDERVRSLFKGLVAKDYIFMIYTSKIKNIFFDQYAL